MIDNEKLVFKILESISKIVLLDRRKVITYDKSKIFPSEIHLLLSIYEGQNTNLTKIAKNFNLTKGAISQTLSRLQKKGLIKKELNVKKKNELHISFTTNGEKLLKYVIKSKKILESEYLNYIKTLSEDNKKAISDFLDIMVTIMNK